MMDMRREHFFQVTCTTLDFSGQVLDVIYYFRETHLHTLFFSNTLSILIHVEFPSAIIVYYTKTAMTKCSICFIQYTHQHLRMHHKLAHLHFTSCYLHWHACPFPWLLQTSVETRGMLMCVYLSCDAFLFAASQFTVLPPCEAYLILCGWQASSILRIGPIDISSSVHHGGHKKRQKQVIKPAEKKQEY